MAIKSCDVVVAIDETVCSMDAVNIRAVFCGVEFSPENLNMIKSALGDLKAKIKFDGKFHMAGIRDHSEQQRVTKFVCELPFIATILLYYDISRSKELTKCEALKRLIFEENRLHKNACIDYRIEYANEYKQLIRESSLKIDDILTFLPDVICYAYSLGLKTNGEHVLYKTARNKIRLEVRVLSGKVSRLKRENKL